MAEANEALLFTLLDLCVSSFAQGPRSNLLWIAAMVAARELANFARITIEKQATRQQTHPNK